MKGAGKKRGDDEAEDKKGPALFGVGLHIRIPGRLGNEILDPGRMAGAILPWQSERKLSGRNPKLSG
jgi:hypothetical protein